MAFPFLGCSFLRTTNIVRESETPFSFGCGYAALRGRSLGPLPLHILRLLVFAERQSTAGQLGPQHLRQYQAYLFEQKKLDAGTVQQHVAGLRFFFVKTLKRRYLLEEIPRPKRHRKLPEILSPEEVAQLIDSASNLFHRTMLMTLYSTGMRRAELCLKVGDIDSKRMVVHIRRGKERKQARFTALLHHMNVDRLRQSFLALKRQAAPGVDGVTWK